VKKLGDIMTGIQFFSPRNYDGSPMKLPVGYRRTVKWLPKIGDIFPNFKLETTHGPLDFWQWAEGSWTYLFSHPEAKTPVCTTEIGALARNQAEFNAVSTKVLGLTGSSLPAQQAWHDDIAKIYTSPVWFPTGCDADGHLALLFGMQHEKEHSSWPIRKSFVIDPQLRIRVMFEYPIIVGRSVEETLRVIEALQLFDSTGFATPSDWYEGDPVIVPNDRREADVVRMTGANSLHVLPYLRMVNYKPKHAKALEGMCGSGPRVL
jgi:peroxiredoxin (alkyl hydroperoxide reductase subunit C)